MPATFHTLEDDWLAAYAAGGLSRAKRLLISCQAAVQPKLSAMLNGFDHIGGAFLEAAHGESVSDGFMTRMMAGLDAPQDERSDAAPSPARDADERQAWMPAPLKSFLQEAGSTLDWRGVGPGVECASISRDGDELLYLLKANGGIKIPEHSHRGEEWTLILQGGYHVGETGYGPGDLHREDETCAHQPIIDDDGAACISLVAVEGRLVFRDPLLKVLQPLFRI
ncbi:MAG: ChrR family anti-sigma-E factor [Pseudomonadota bacterium]